MEAAAEGAKLALVDVSPLVKAAVITFLTTASGMTFLGLGSAFWGVIIGAIACASASKKAHPGTAERSSRIGVFSETE